MRRGISCPGCPEDAHEPTANVYRAGRVPTLCLRRVSAIPARTGVPGWRGSIAPRQRAEGRRRGRLRVRKVARVRRCERWNGMSRLVICSSRRGDSAVRRRLRRTGEFAVRAVGRVIRTAFPHGQGATIECRMANGCSCRHRSRSGRWAQKTKEIGKSAERKRLPRGSPAYAQAAAGRPRSYMELAAAARGRKSCGESGLGLLLGRLTERAL